MMLLDLINPGSSRSEASAQAQPQVEPETGEVKKGVNNP
jgi:hypothetical protein